MKHPIKHRRLIAKSLEGFAERQRKREAARKAYRAQLAAETTPRYRDGLYDYRRNRRCD